MKKVLESRGFVMAVVGAIFIILTARIVGVVDVGLATICVGLVGTLFTVKVAGDQIKKVVRTKKGITYDTEHECEVMIDGFKKE